MQHGSRARQRHKEKAGGLYVHIARDTGKMDMGSQSGDVRRMDAQGGGGVRPLVHVGGGGSARKGAQNGRPSEERRPFYVLFAREIR